MHQLQEVDVEVRSNDEYVRRPHRALDFDGGDSSQSVQDRITKFNNLCLRGGQGTGESTT